MIRSSNPTLHNLNRYADDSAEGATYGGISWKTCVYVAITIAAAVFACLLLRTNFTLALILLAVSGVVAFVSSLVASFAPRTAAISGSVYAFAEGFLLGSISALFEGIWSGIVLAAFLCTMVVFALMMILYSTGIIRVGGRFRRFLTGLLLGVLVTQLLILIVGLISPAVWNLFYGSGPVAIIVSVVMVIIASMCILSDLDNITMTVENGLPKTYEWRAAFGLSVSLLWLYLEFLRLFALIASQKD